MASCEPASMVLVIVTILFVVPLGLPILGAAFHAWRKQARWASALGAVLSLAGLLVTLVVVRDHPGDPRWWPFLFLPPLALCAAAALAPHARLRLAALAASALPTLGFWAYGVSQWLANRAIPCPG